MSGGADRKGSGAGRLLKIGKYEIGQTLGEGTFGKVKYAVHEETREAVAIKVLDKAAIEKLKMAEQIKREITVLRLVKGPNVVSLHEVLATKTKICLVLELVTGGEVRDVHGVHGVVLCAHPATPFSASFSLACAAVRQDRQKPRRQVPRATGTLLLQAAHFGHRWLPRAGCVPPRHQAREPAAGQ